MSRIIAAGLAAALSVLIVPGASAQSKVIPGERHTATATIELVDVPTRSVTVRTNKGELHTFQVPEQATRLDELKAGDTVTATYYDNIMIRHKAVGEPEVDTLQ